MLDVYFNGQSYGMCFVCVALDIFFTFNGLQVNIHTHVVRSKQCFELYTTAPVTNCKEVVGTEPNFSFRGSSTICSI